MVVLCQWAVKHGDMLEFGERDNHLDCDGEIISRNDYLENVYTLFRKAKYSFYKSNERYCIVKANIKVT